MCESEARDVDYTQVIGRNVILYGESGTGKSTIILDLLYSIKDKVPSCFVISPTEQQNGTYSGIIPDLMIDSRPMTEEKMKQKLVQIIKRQQQVSSEYRIANDQQVLESIIQLLQESNNVSEAFTKQLDMIQSQIEVCKQKQQQAGVDEILKSDKVQLQHITDTLDKKISKIQQMQKGVYKQIIDENIQLLLSGSVFKLTQQQVIAVTNIHLNPNMLVILDDCGAIFEKLQKDKAIQDIFFAGRHYFITTIIAVQSDNTVCPTIRAQAFFSFFCSPRILERFGKSNNGLDPKTAKFYADRMRQNNDEHERVLFVRQENICIPFIPLKRQQFRFGSKTIWDFCDFLYQHKKQ